MKNTIPLKTKYITSALIIMLLFCAPSIADYTGDKPLGTYLHDTINGNIIYLANSSYLGLDPNDTTSVDLNISLPSGATVKNARLYSYYTWSKSGESANTSMTLNGISLIPDKHYWDSKGSGSNNYPSGTVVYNVTEYVTGSGSYTATLENIGTAKFYTYGMALLVVYENPSMPSIEYWINEGCDMLWNTSTYNITAENATTSALFSGEIAIETVKNAILKTVVTGGDKGNNTLFFNDANWTGVYNASTSKEIVIDSREVTNNLVSVDNQAKIQDNGDYMTATNAILIVQKKVKGDFNGNGEVDIGDVTKVAYMVVGKVPADLEADFNGNGKVDIGDASKIAYYYVGKIESL